MVDLPDIPNGPCTSEEPICKGVLDLTGNEGLAKAADFLIGPPLAVLVIVVVGLLVRWLLHRLIDRTVKRAESPIPGQASRVSLGGHSGRRAQRARAMGSLLKSVTTVIVLGIVVVMALAEVGVEVAPLIASAGIIGVAVAFGAQSLVQDFLSGIFMIFEDQYGVGDWIDLGDCDGEVEAVSLRVTRLRDMNGTVWYVRNGEVLRVGNFSQNWARTVLDVGVAYTEDLARVSRIIEEVAGDLWEDEDYRGTIIERPELWGVQAVTPEGVSVRVALKTAPLAQWGVGRELRKRIKARFDHEGIKVPYPDWVLGEGSGRADARYLAQHTDDSTQ